MKYYLSNNVHIIECDPSEFKIVLENKKKKNLSYKTYTNANFFANYKESGTVFTLPVGHLIADYNSDSTSVKKYCTERGKFIGDKFYFDSSKWSYGNQFNGKALSTLIIANGKASIIETTSLKTSYAYAVSGVPVMRNGTACKFSTDVKSQGYDSSTLYATKHIFIGLKKDSNKIYICGYKTTKANLVYSGEAYTKFKALGMYDVIKLDGGGSYHFKYNGTVKDTMSENRRINGVIVVDGVETQATDTTKEVSFDTPSTWAKDAWNTAVAKGVFDGTAPQGNVSREMLSVVLNKLQLL